MRSPAGHAFWTLLGTDECMSTIQTTPQRLLILDLFLTANSMSQTINEDRIALCCAIRLTCAWSNADIVAARSGRSRLESGVLRRVSNKTRTFLPSPAPHEKPPHTSEGEMYRNLCCASTRTRSLILRRRSSQIRTCRRGKNLWLRRCLPSSPG